jgi:hypothetical protein
MRNTYLKHVRVRFFLHKVGTDKKTRHLQRQIARVAFQRLKIASSYALKPEKEPKLLFLLR